MGHAVGYNREKLCRLDVIRMGDWHSRPVTQLFKELDSRAGGLSSREAAQRLERKGPNELSAPPRPARIHSSISSDVFLVSA